MSNNPKAIPDGFHSVTPLLVVKEAARAIEFYKQAFGATEVAPALKDPGSGKIAHAEIKVGDSLIMLADEIPEWGNTAPPTIGGSPVRIHLYVEDVDRIAQQAVDAGAKLLIPVEDQFYGDRAGRLEDPFGHIWIVATHKEDLTPEDMQQRFEAMMSQQADG